MWRWAVKVVQKKREEEQKANIFNHSQTMRPDQNLLKESHEESNVTEQNEETLAKIEAQSKNHFKKKNFIQR